MRRKRRRPDYAAVVEVSAVGAAVLVRSKKVAKPGATIIIGLDKARGVVRVRRVDATSHESVTFYAVEFVSLDAQLKERLRDAALQQRRHG